MRIGIDCRQIYDIKKNTGSGVERYVYNLVRELLSQKDNHKYFLFLPKKISQKTVDSLLKIRKFKVIKVSDTIPFLSSHVFFTFKLWSIFLHWMIFPANVMPVLYVGKSLLIIHDVAIYNHPEWFLHEHWFLKIILMPSSVAKATKIVAISQTTKEDLLELFKFKKEKKIKLIYPGILPVKKYSDLAKKELFERFKITRDYLFFLGTIDPRKNLVNLFKAFNQYLKETKTEINLIVAGAKGWKDKRIFATLKQINENWGRQVIRYLGKITDKEKNILMQNCRAFVFPSFHEGFGAPVLEAMANGAPVVTSKFSATGEYIYDQAAKIDPKNINEIFQAIKKILEDKDYREELIRKGYELSSKFVWSKSAKELLEFIKIQKDKE